MVLHEGVAENIWLGGSWYERLIDAELPIIYGMQAQFTEQNGSFCHLGLERSTWGPYESKFFDRVVCPDGVRSGGEGAVDVMAATVINPGPDGRITLDDLYLVPRHQCLFDTIMQTVTLAAEPKRVIQWYLPITVIMFCVFLRAFRLDKPVRSISQGFHTIISCALGWQMTTAISQTIKNIVRADRPYWTIPRFLKQFPMTCETGGGFPSGHMASTSYTVHFALLTGIAYVRRRHNGHTKNVISGVMIGMCQYLLYWAAYSRVYTSSHFIHQTVTGWAIGLSTAIAIKWLMPYEFFERVLDSGGSLTSNPLMRGILYIGIILMAMQLIVILAVTRYSVRGPDYTKDRSKDACYSNSNLKHLYLGSKATDLIIENALYLFMFCVIPFVMLIRKMKRSSRSSIEGMDAHLEFPPLKLSLLSVMLTPWIEQVVSESPKEKRSEGSNFIIHTSLGCICWYLSKLGFNMAATLLPAHGMIPYAINGMWYGGAPWVIGMTVL